MPKGIAVSKSPLQEKRLYFLNKYSHFINRRAYTFSIQQNVKITYKIRNDNIKEI